MAKRSGADPNQMEFNFRFGEKVDAFISAKQEILEAVEEKPAASQPVENEFEACMEIAAAVKRAIRDSGIPRKQIPEKVNAYFGRSEEGAKADPPTCRNPLTLNMLNNYLSKPKEYPIPAYYLYAIHHITGNFAPAEAIVSAEGAKVATVAEIRQMNLGRLEQNIAEMQRLKRELKKT